MKQLHVKNYWKVLYGGGAQTIGLLDAGNAPVFPSSGIHLPIPTIVRNLSLYCANPAHTGITLTVQKNGVDTALSVTSPGTVVTPVKNTGIAVSYAAGDNLRARFIGAGYFFGDAPSVGVCIETEAAENIYGRISAVGGLGAEIGGALGNGHDSNYGGAFPPGVTVAPSNSHSICAIPGTLTGLSARINIVPGANVYISYIVKNSQVQDGTSGTVDTRCILTGATQFLYQPFLLPVAILDTLDILVLRTAGSASAVISNCVTLNPTTAGRFMFCGGSNAAINSALDYRWNDSTQDAQPEEQKAGIVGVGGVVVHGKYIHKHPPGSGATQTTTNTLRRNSTDTSLSVTLTQLQTSGSDLGDEIFPEDSSIDIKCTNTNGGDGNSLFWGIPVSLIAPNTLVVHKVTDPSGSAQVFNFTAGGGLSPAAFTLQDGGVQSFAGLAPGSYSIAETPVPEWTTTIEVSNGNPPSAIVMASGDTVTVTVTNVDTSGGGNGGNGGNGDSGDCPEQVSAGCWSPHDANRLTVELDGDYDV